MAEVTSAPSQRPAGKSAAAKSAPAPAKGTEKKPSEKKPSEKKPSEKNQAEKNQSEKKLADKAAVIAAVKNAKSAQAAAKAGTAGKAGAPGKGAKGAASVKGGKDGKKVVIPAAPPRKIQVVQRSTLKPGARGTKATVKRQPAVQQDGVTPGAMKKRRSSELTKQQLDHFTDLLQQRRSRLSHDLSLMQDEALKVTAQDNSSDSVADTGTDNYEQDFTLGLIESEEALAREVDGALLRIAQNAFGVCESCQTPIPLARLEILPFARFCVDCQQKREGRG